MSCYYKMLRVFYSDVWEKHASFDLVDGIYIQVSALNFSPANESFRTSFKTYTALKLSHRHSTS